MTVKRCRAYSPILAVAASEKKRQARNLVMRL